MQYLGATTTPLQEQLAPPDDCRNCLRQNVLAHNTHAQDGTIQGAYECPECSYHWTQTWRIEPITDGAPHTAAEQLGLHQ